jgi:putative membrane protein
VNQGIDVLDLQAADAFLATQGDPWDTQWDMLCCLLGAIASIGLFTIATDLHERQLARLPHRLRAGNG